MAYRDNQSQGCTLIKQARLTTLSEGMLYRIYADKEGLIYAETCSSWCQIADSLEEFNRMPLRKLESMVYGFEMSVAR